MEKINKTKGLEVYTKEGFAPDDIGFWGLATVEEVDRVGDVVMVDGLTMADNLKIFVQHLRMLSDGTPAIVAKVTKSEKIDFGGKKALIVYSEWLKDDEGKMLPLAQVYYDYVKAGGIDSFSIGFSSSNYEQNKDTGGINYIEANIHEISLVSIPANAGARLLKELFTKDDIDIEGDNKIVALEKELSDIKIELEVIKSELFVLTNVKQTKDSGNNKHKTSDNSDVVLELDKILQTLKGK